MYVKIIKHTHTLLVTCQKRCLYQLGQNIYPRPHSCSWTNAIMLMAVSYRIFLLVSPVIDFTIGNASKGTISPSNRYRLCRHPCTTTATTISQYHNSWWRWRWWRQCNCCDWYSYEKNDHAQYIPYLAKDVATACKIHGHVEQSTVVPYRYAYLWLTGTRGLQPSET